MTATTIEKHKILLSYLGEQKVMELYHIFGNERLSFATINQIIELQRVKEVVQTQKNVKAAAKKCGLHRSTIYRLIKKSRRFENFATKADL